jgi:hypothetical protein
MIRVGDVFNAEFTGARFLHVRWNDVLAAMPPEALLE